MKKTYSVIVARLGLEEGKELPEWYLIFPEGESEVEGHGKFTVDRKAFEVCKAEIDRRGIEIVFDYEHQTIKDVKAPAAGWNKDWRYTDGVGIEARVDWTKEAEGYLAKNEYRYFSPVFVVRNRRLVAVHSVALTNSPRTNQQKALIAKLAGAEHSQEKGMELLKILITALGMSEDSTEDEVVAKIKEFVANDGQPVVAKDIRAALGVEEDDLSVVVASINALKQVEKTMVSKEDFNILQKRLDKQDAEQLVAVALKDGKITPDQQEWALEYAERDSSGFETFIAKAPVVVNVKGLPSATQTAGDGSLTQEEMIVAKQMGVDLEELKKHKKETAA